MKQKYQSNFERDELDILSEQLEPKELYILGFLKGFDRKVLKEWGKKGIFDFSINVI
jgi:hypothetical protein